MEQQHDKNIQPNEPAHEGEPSQKELLRRVHEMEQEIDALRSKSAHLQVPHNHNDAHVTVSPLVLSPSSIPPADSELHKHKTHNKDDELIDQIRMRDQKIEFLEQNLALFQKRLRQTEELLYELQWDPDQDNLFSHLEDKSTLESKYEKKIAQLLEQMRIMERGLREKQQIIDELCGNHNTHFKLIDSAEIPRTADHVDRHLSPTLKGLIISNGPSPRSSGMLYNNSDHDNLTNYNTNYNINNNNNNGINIHNMPPGVSLERRGSQTIRRRNSNSASPASASWLSYIPFWGNDNKQSL